MIDDYEPQDLPGRDQDGHVKVPTWQVRVAADINTDWDYVTAPLPREAAQTYIRQWYYNPGLKVPLKVGDKLNVLVKVPGEGVTLQFVITVEQKIEFKAKRITYVEPEKRNIQ